MIALLALAACQGQSEAPITAPEEATPSPQSLPAITSQAEQSPTDKSQVNPEKKPEKAVQGTQSMQPQKEAAPQPSQPVQAQMQEMPVLKEKPRESGGESAPATELVSPPAVERKTAISTTPSLPQGDAERGRKVAGRCLACHNFSEKAKVGPGLAGIYGRKAGTQPFRYSEALKQADWVWDDEHLAAWVCDARDAIRRFSGNPQAKTKMPKLGICDADKQADLIAFLKTL